MKYRKPIKFKCQMLMLIFDNIDISDNYDMIIIDLNICVRFLFPCHENYKSTYKHTL